MRVHFLQGFHLTHGITQIFNGAGHLLGIALGIHVRFLHEAEAARQLMHHLLSAGLKFREASARILHGGLLAFQLLAGAIQLGQLRL